MNKKVITPENAIEFWDRKSNSYVFTVTDKQDIVFENGVYIRGDVKFGSAGGFIDASNAVFVGEKISAHAFCGGKIILPTDAIIDELRTPFECGNITGKNVKVNKLVYSPAAKGVEILCQNLVVETISSKTSSLTEQTPPHKVVDLSQQAAKVKKGRTA